MKELNESRAVSQTLAPLHILVVDDSQDVREVLQYFLQEKGALVDIAMDGAEAISKVHNERFDLIIMDLHMPGLNGVDTALKLKKLPSETIIFAITADINSNKMLNTGADNPFDDIILKPFSPSHLTSRILDKITR
ncbi:MAG: response regulator [Deltaproteobacteria bacterium]|nr:response regulator [Deltaproteobacteria bacterium]